MNIFAQYERTTSGGSVVNSGDVIFDGTLNFSGNISLNTSTGEITIGDTGTYFVYWWVATQSTAGSNFAGFSIANPTIAYGYGYSASTYGQVSGFSVIKVSSTPFVFTLKNSSYETLYYSTDTNNTAAIQIVQDEIIPNAVLYAGQDANVSFTLVVNDAIPVGNDYFYIGLDIERPDNTTINLDPGVYLIDFTIVGSATSSATIQFTLDGTNIYKEFYILEGINSYSTVVEVTDNAKDLQLIVISGTITLAVDTSDQLNTNFTVTKLISPQ